MNRLIYFVELLMLLPFFPYLYWKGKKLRQQVQRLPQQSTYLNLEGNKSAQNILIIGESTAAGVGASSPENTFAAHFFEQAKGEFSVLNLGKNGLKGAGLNRLLSHAKPDLPFSFSKVIILIGANDCFKFTPPSKFRKEIQSFVEIFEKTDHTPLIFIPSIPPVNHFPAIPLVLQVFLGIHRYILNRELQSLDKKIKTLHYHEWKSGFTSDFFASDGIHPSNLGYKKMAEEAYLQIKG